jgi:hypothetical protein
VNRLENIIVFKELPMLFSLGQNYKTNNVKGFVFIRKSHVIVVVFYALHLNKKTVDALAESCS